MQFAIGLTTLRLDTLFGGPRQPRIGGLISNPLLSGPRRSSAVIRVIRTKTGLSDEFRRRSNDRILWKEKLDRRLQGSYDPLLMADPVCFNGVKGTDRNDVAYAR